MARKKARSRSKRRQGFNNLWNKMPHPVPRAEDDDLDALNGRLAAVDLERKDENSRPINPFAP
jgi:hypothetical protein